MAGWHIWAALIVGAVIWMIGQLLLRNNQDEKRGQAAPGPEGRGPGQRRPSIASTELDRYLQEANRRKQSAEQRARAQGERRSAPIPPARAAMEAPPVTGPGRAASPPPVRRQPPPSLAQAASTGTRLRRPIEDDMPVVLEVVPMAEPGPPLPAAVPAGPARSASPALRQLVAMLSSRDNLRAAVLLREVLDRPMCHRRR
jgi:hypothetical protein